MTDNPELVHVGWWCWRGDNHGHLGTMACRSDNVPIHVPTEWADDMRAVIQRIEDGDGEPDASAGVAPASCPDPIECSHEAALGEARETNRRLNYRAQQLESELAAYRRAVAQWEINERRTYVPLRTLAMIAKAAGRDIENPQWLLHYQRVEQAEAAIERVRSVLESEAVRGRSALDFRGLITSALMPDGATADRAAESAPADTGHDDSETPDVDPVYDPRAWETYRRDAGCGCTAPAPVDCKIPHGTGAWLCVCHRLSGPATTDPGKPLALLSGDVSKHFQDPNRCLSVDGIFRCSRPTGHPGGHRTGRTFWGRRAEAEQPAAVQQPKEA